MPKAWQDMSGRPLLASRFLFLFATDPPNVVEHYDACAEAMRERFPESEMICFELPSFGMSHSRRGSMEELAQDLRGFILKVREAYRGELVLVMPCVSALFCPIVLPSLPAKTVSRLVVLQCADYAGEKRWAETVNVSGMLSMPGARLLNYLKAKQMSCRWYDTTFPRRGSYQECSGCTQGTEVATGAREARSWFSAVASEALDAGARFPLAWCLQRLFYAPRGSELVRVLQEEREMIDVETLVLWGMQDGSHRTNLRGLEASSRPSFARYVSAPVRQCCFAESAHFPELQEPRRFAQAVFDFLHGEEVQEHGGLAVDAPCSRL